MCLAAYPFFHDVAATTGRLLALQGRAALSQIVRRVTEVWGTRSTVTRAAQRVVRSFIDWGALTETGARGIYGPAPKIAVHGGGLGAWLSEAESPPPPAPATRSTAWPAKPRSIRSPGRSSSGLRPRKINPPWKHCAASLRLFRSG